MKNLITITLGSILLASCGKNVGNAFIKVEDKKGCTVTQILNGVLIKCDDGSETIVYNGANGKNGIDGADGVDGQDGSTPLVHTKVVVAKNECKKILDGIWVESISNGEFFDVYYNDMCKDSHGEFCDNVESSYGRAGTFGSQTKGSGSVCWANDVQISGALDTNSKELTIHAITFK